MYIFCTFIIIQNFDLHDLCIQNIYKLSVLYNFCIHIAQFMYKFFGKGFILLSWSTLNVAISKCIVFLFCFFYFNWLQLIQRASKVNLSWNFRCFTKEAVLLLHSRSTLHIAFSKCHFCWSWLFYFDFPLFTKVNV